MHNPALDQPGHRSLQDLVELIDELGAALIETEPSDLDAVHDLRRRFADLVELLGRQGHDLASARASACVALLDGVLQSEQTGEPSAAVLDALSGGVSALQEIVRDQPMPKSAPFPGRPIEPAACDSDGPRAASSASATSAEPIAPPSPNRITADPELLAGFISESQEHLEAAESHLLVLDGEPDNQESLNAVFRSFHTIKGVAGFLELKDIVVLAHEAENLLDRARSGQLPLIGAASDAAFASVDVLKRCVECLKSGVMPSDKAELKTVCDAMLASLRRVLARGDAVSPAGETAEHAARSRPFAPQGAADEPRGPVEAAHETAKAEDKPNATPKSGGGEATHEAVKVDRDRLDRLVDMIGELVIAESMVQQELLASSGELVHAARSAVQLSKITRNLQELSLSLRMVPVRGAFQKMARLVRDLSKKIDKPVDFHMQGEDTELDKTVVDQIGDPLMHMVRNAVDHGIEAAAAERTAAGKPTRGQVTMRAFHRGGNIHIEIEDDGRGLNRERILAKARQQGLIGDEALLTDREVFALIFQPGFSTAEKLTDVSGRGVGMDVVRRNVEALRGSVELRSEPGRGTCFTMRLPLTLAIIDGMAVRVGANRYIIPTLSIVELVRLRSGEVSTVRQRAEMFQIRDRLLPFLRIARLFHERQAEQDPAQGITVVVEGASTMAGLLVDEVLGQQQAVIKNLGKGLEGRRGIAGGAIMPDGKVGLILDIHGLLEIARESSQTFAVSATALPPIAAASGSD